jgi:hypothetical protein
MVQHAHSSSRDRPICKYASASTIACGRWLLLLREVEGAYRSRCRSLPRVARFGQWGSASLCVCEVTRSMSLRNNSDFRWCSTLKIGFFVAFCFLFGGVFWKKQWKCCKCSQPVISSLL